MSMLKTNALGLLGMGGGGGGGAEQKFASSPPLLNAGPAERFFKVGGVRLKYLRSGRA